MNAAIRIAVHMQPARDENGATKFRAALPMGALLEKSLDKQEVEHARIALEEKYTTLVNSLSDLRLHLQDGNVLRYWMFGDTIVTFENQTADVLVFVDKLSDHLARDVDYSKTMIDLCRRFRLKLAENEIDPCLSFDAYHRNGFDPQRAAAYEQAKQKRRRSRPRKS